MSPAVATDDPTRAAGRADHGRLQMLDGWRAISILLVIAAHMLPLGPNRYGVNSSVALLGMAIFFTLSGFLIVSILLRDRSIPAFLLKRLARIVPLAWATLIVVLALAGADAATWVSNLFFYANLPPFHLDFAPHFWSLGVEMQFYVAIALVVLLLGRRGLWTVPVAAVAVTALRIATGTEMSIVTWLRVDEILAGGTLALVIHGPSDAFPRRWLARIPFWPIALLFLLSGQVGLPPLGYARPYLAATMVGITILRPVGGLSPLLLCRPAAYVARISYALYVFHPFSMTGWLGSGTGMEKYLKRPLCFALTFAAAHLSTEYFERPINDRANRLARRSPFRRETAAKAVEPAAPQR